MEMSQSGSSGNKASNPNRTAKCHACGSIGYYAECRHLTSETETAKVVHKELIGLTTENEDPKMRCSEWYLGSRCTVHVCNSRDMFVDYEPWSGHEVVLDNNEHADVAGIGTVALGFATGKVLTLSNVFHIPTVGKCLVSLYKLAEIGCKISLESGGLAIKKNHEIVGRGYLEDELYWLSTNEDIKSETKVAKVVHKEVIGLITVNEDPVLAKLRRRGWYVASRCTVHVCNSRDMFLDYKPLTNHVVVLDTDDQAEVAGTGTVVLRLTTGKVLTLSNVFHVPAIRKCLVSVGKLTCSGFMVSFGAEGTTIYKKNNEIVGKGFVEDGLYRLSINEDIKSAPKVAKVVHNEVIGLITVNEDPILAELRRRGWYVASRCTVHVCNSRDMFVDYQSWTNHEVVLDNNEHVDVAGFGTVVLRFTTGKVLTLSNVFHIPAIKKCLVSVGKLTDSGFMVSFGAGETTIHKKNHEIVGKGSLENGLYRLSINEGIKSDTKVAKLVHNEVIGLITVNEDPVLAELRGRGWYVASRCTVHVCNSRDMFVGYEPWTNHEVVLDNNEHVDVAGIGTVVLRFTTGKVLTMSNVFHIPTIRKCLVSMGKLTDSGFIVSFGAGGTTIHKKNHDIVGKGFLEDGLYRLSISEDRKTDPKLDNERADVGNQAWSSPDRVVFSNNEHVDAAGTGTINIGKFLTLSDVLIVPGLKDNILSVSKLCEMGFSVHFGAEGITVYNMNQEIVGNGDLENGLFRMSFMK